MTTLSLFLACMLVLIPPCRADFRIPTKVPIVKFHSFRVITSHSIGISDPPPTIVSVVSSGIGSGIGSGSSRPSASEPPPDGGGNGNNDPAPTSSLSVGGTHQTHVLAPLDPTAPSSASLPGGTTSVYPSPTQSFASLLFSDRVTAGNGTEAFSISTPPSASPLNNNGNSINSTITVSLISSTTLAALNSGIIPDPSSSSNSNLPEITTSPSRSPGIKPGGIVGIVLGGVALLAVVIIGILLWHRKRRIAAAVNIHGHKFDSELTRGYPLPYIVQAFITPTSLGRIFQKQSRALDSSPAPAQEEKTLGGLPLATSFSDQTPDLPLENTNQSNLPQSHESNQAEVLPQRPQSTLPQVPLTHVTAELSATLFSSSPQPPSSQLPPSSYSSHPEIQRRRQSTDAGIRLAGGRPGEIHEDSEEDTDGSSTLPPAYEDY